MEQPINWQEKVNNFAVEHNLSATTGVYLLDLVSEVGEVAKEHLKATDYGRRQPDVEKLQIQLKEELGDVLFSLCMVANTANVDLNEALNAVLGKYAARWASSGQIGSGSGGQTNEDSLK